MGKSDPSKRLSPDAERISRAVESRTLTAAFLKKAASDDPRLRSQLDLTADLTLMAAALQNPKDAATQKLAVRALVKRVGAFAARRLIALTLPVANEDLKLSLAIRADSDRADRGKARKDRLKEQQAAELLELDTLYRTVDGLPPAEARSKAIQDLRKISSGLDGAKKAVALARAKALERGFIHPAEPEKVLYFGASAEPKVTLADLPPPHRPKKGAK